MSPERIEAPVRDPQRYSPVFILASARSYSSVVCTMIGQHPELAGLPELKLFSYPTIGQLEASLPQTWIDRGVTHRSPGLVRAVAEYKFGGQDANDLAEALVWLRNRSHWTGASVLDSILDAIAPRPAVEKSPESVATEDALKRLSAAYPKARYLHLTRHPVTTQQSAQEHWNRIFPQHPLAGEPMAGIACWVETNCRILRFASTLEHGRYLRVRAEDVLNHADVQLGVIANWLGIRADADALEAMMHPETSPFSRFAPQGSGILGGNDPGFLSNPIPRRVPVLSSVEQPAGWAGEQALWRMAIEVASCLGYP